MDRAHIRKLEEFVRDIRDNWDCDADSHRHGHTDQCRKCSAKKLLGEDSEDKGTERFRYFIVFRTNGPGGSGTGNVEIDRDLPIRSENDVREVEMAIKKTATTPRVPGLVGASIPVLNSVTLLSWRRFEEDPQGGH